MWAWVEFNRVAYDGQLVLGSSLLLGGIGAGSLMNPVGTLVFLADFLDETTGDQILEFLVSTKAEHFFSTTDGVAFLEVGENGLEEIVEAKYFLPGQHIAEFVSDVIGQAAREAGTFGRDCHNRFECRPFLKKSD